MDVRGEMEFSTCRMKIYSTHNAGYLCYQMKWNIYRTVLQRGQNNSCAIISISWLVQFRYLVTMIDDLKIGNERKGVYLWILHWIKMPMSVGNQFSGQRYTIFHTLRCSFFKYWHKVLLTLNTLSYPFFIVLSIDLCFTPLFVLPFNIENAMFIQSWRAL